ncbi:hypothetical protein KGM_213034 [Danaus plexippus plexippus]|uniref:Uncharacterized protein n=1 Tax=Danaus plexippus plexippus TaxID=278856 RepID=A0A212F0W7_DANPL|nr:hypothetical protein KGM_213034 [Danaus plexippus plexippus]
MDSEALLTILTPKWPFLEEHIQR